MMLEYVCTASRAQGGTEYVVPGGFSSAVMYEDFLDYVTVRDLLGAGSQAFNFGLRELDLVLGANYLTYEE